MSNEVPDTQMKLDDPKVGSEGIKQDNASLGRNELAMQGATKQSFVTAMESKIRGEHPDWANDKVKSVALAAYNKATSDIASGKGNEENSEETVVASDDLKTKGAPA